jgi:hypothetical protein
MKMRNVSMPRAIQIIVAISVASSSNLLSAHAMPSSLSKVLLSQNLEERAPDGAQQPRFARICIEPGLAAPTPGGTSGRRDLSNQFDGVAALSLVSNLGTRLAKITHGFSNAASKVRLTILGAVARMSRVLSG